MQTQNFKNHSQLVPLFHFVTLPAILALIVGSFINLSNAVGKGEGIYSASLICLVAIILLLVAFLARAFGLKAQDRAIRAEENFRHFIATGKPMDNRLRLSQVIALRFAGDVEFIALSKKAANENLSSKDIKLAIKDWRGDYHRV
jgi:L-cystine uptake protein TcyP (sodium:dicarboxylate symporter family)